jgi:hypothetical protein
MCYNKIRGKDVSKAKKVKKAPGASERKARLRNSLATFASCGRPCYRGHNPALAILRRGLGLSPNQAVGADHPKLKPLEREKSLVEGGSPPL